MRKVLLFLFLLVNVATLSFSQSQFSKSEVKQSVDKRKAAAVAQNQMVIGYCSDELSTNGLGTRTTTDLSAAVFFPKNKIQKYSGNKLKTIRFGILNTSVSNLSVWIKTSLTGQAVYSQDFDGTLVNGWNEVELTTPYDIDGTPIYVGFTFRQPAYTYPLSFVGADLENAAFLAVGTVWEDFYGSGYGCLSLQCVVEGENLPQYDLSVNALNLDKPYAKTDGNIVLVAEIENLAQQTVTSCDVTYKIGDDNPVTETFQSNLAYRQKGFFSKSIPAAAYSGKTSISLSVDNLNGNADEDLSDNSASGEVYVYSESFPKKVLVEHFTTIPCGNCPSGLRALNGALAGKDIAWVAHHVGFEFDKFTINDSYSYIPFFGGGSYAPAAMFDRTRIPATGESCPVFGISYGVANEAWTIQYISSLIDWSLSLPAFISVNIEGGFNPETLSVDLDITGEALSSFFDVADNAFVTVFLTEDGLSGTQSGQTGTVTHNHALRKVLTSALGSPMTWDGNKYSCKVTGVLDKTWVVENMKIIAFVNNYDSQDINNGKIMNTAEVRLSSVSTGLDAWKAGNELSVYHEDGIIKARGAYDKLQVYSSNGAAVVNEGLLPGLYFAKLTRNNEVVTKKIIIK